MTWHYQIRKRLLNGEPWFDIVESFSEPTGWTRDGVEPGAETKEGVIHCLELMLRDAKRYPVLEEKE